MEPSDAAWEFVEVGTHGAQKWCQRVAAVTGLALAVVVLGPSSAAVASAHRALPVTGYAGDWTSPSVVEAQARALTVIGVDGVDLNARGNAVARPSAAARQLLAAAHAAGLRAVLLVGDYDDDSATPSVTAGRLLHSARKRARVVAELVRIVRHQGWNGITVDLEDLSASDAAGLVGFVARLHRELPRGDQLAVDVAATPNLSLYPEIGYHLRGLAKVANVVLMAYDESGPWSLPGPIGGLPWQRLSIAAVRHLVPADRLVLGVAAYGYTWPTGAGVHDGIAVTDFQARQLARASGKSPKWIRSQGEWTVRLRNGTVLWWADTRSYKLRDRLATRDHLAGLAIWQLATADQLPARS
jgi:spore germination protein YaaH